MDNRLRLRRCDLSPQLEQELVGAFTHANPTYAKNAAMGYSVYRVPPKVCTARLSPKELSLPRGGTGKVREVLARHDAAPSWVDARLTLEPVELPRMATELRRYQLEAVEKMAVRENCLLRAPTGSGKTVTAIGLIARLRQPALVVVWSANLLEQWRTRLVSDLGLRQRDVGIIRGGRATLAPVTIAMQQSLWARGVPESIAQNFGLVVVDECFDADAQVLMADGTQERIADVKVGEEVAVGGRVTAKYRHYHDGVRFAIGDSYVTGDHPIATDRGWVIASMVRSDDSLWYDPLHELRDLRIESQGEQPKGDLSSARLEQELRPSDGEVPPLWRDHPGTIEGESRCYEMPDGWTLEQGTHGGRRPETRLTGQERDEARSLREDRGCLEGPNDPCSLRGGHQPGSAQAILEGVGEGCVEGEDSTVDPGRQDRPVRREEPRQWKTTDRLGARDAAPTGETLVRCGACGPDRLGPPPLQDRPGEPSNESSCGTRRRESQWDREEEVGREEGLVPEVSRVAGSSIPGWPSGRVRLRLGSADVRRSVEGSGLVYNLETERGVYVAAGVLVHNCQRCASRTLSEVVDALPARYRFGISADHRRKDGMDFITVDLFGPPAADIPMRQLVRDGTVHDVEVRVVPTEFSAPWYGSGETDTFDFNRLLAEMTRDEARNQLVAGLALRESRAGRPTLVFTHRVEHARHLADELLAGEGCGLLVGGPENSVRFEEDRRRLLEGKIRIAVGTVQAIGQGLDLPNVSRGVVATPVAGNRQLWGQVRGRICRTAEGKEDAVVYALWDPGVAPHAKHLRNLAAWNDSVSVLEGDRWVPAREYARGLAGRQAERERGARDLPDIFE